MKPAPRVFVTVTFSEYACALAGIPGQRGSEFRSKFRGTPAPSAGGPNPAGKAACRVSTSRQGVMPMKGRGDVDDASSVSIRMSAPLSCRETGCVGGLQCGGAGQLAIFTRRPDGSARSSPRARETEKTSVAAMTWRDFISIPLRQQNAHSHRARTGAMSAFLDMASVEIHVRGPAADLLDPDVLNYL